MFENFDYAKLLWLVPPAAILSFIIYYIKLSGKMITDYDPYCDDRRYAEQLNGLTFFLAQILWPGLLALITFVLVMKYTPIKSITWLAPIVTLIIFSFYSLKLNFAAAKFFDREERMEPIRNVLSRLDFIRNDLSKSAADWLFSPVRHNGKILFVLFVLFSLNVVSKDWLSIPVNFLFLFIILLILPSNYAMSRYKLLPAEIFLDNKTTVVGKIIRVNDDTIRLKKDDKIIIISKSKMVKIEIKLKH
jgi:hypothetical protein